MLLKRNERNIFYSSFKGYLLVFEGYLLFLFLNDGKMRFRKYLLVWRTPLRRTFAS